MSEPTRTAAAPGGPASAAAAAQVGLVALFVTALITAQLTAAKLIAVPLPAALPAVGAEIVLPGAAVAYAVTFLASDCYAELYGRRAAQVVVNVAFGMNFLMLGLLWTTLAAPAVDPEFGATFAAALAPAGNVVAGSLLAYLLSQNWDVIAFHRLRAATDGRHLWLRNLASTASSQAIDTVVFVGVAFLLAPRLLGVGDPVPTGVAVSLIAGQYLLKLAIAALDTPFVYLIVGTVRRRGGAPA